MKATWFVVKTCLRMGTGGGWVFGKKDLAKLGIKVTDDYKFEVHEEYVKIVKEK